MNLQRLNEVTAELNRTTPENITGVGYGLAQRNGKTLSEYCITFTVDKKLPLDEIPEENRIPSQIEIDGVIYNTDVVEGVHEFTGYVNCSDSDPSFYSWQSTRPANQNTARPLVGGVSIGNVTTGFLGSGTMGFIAVDNDDDTLVGISNNHVLIKDAFYTSERDPNLILTNTVGNVGVQATFADTFEVNPIGVIKKYQPIFEDPVPNLADVACVAISQVDEEGNSTIDSNESWKQSGFENITSPPRFATTSEIDAALNNPNQEFFSSGRTTGPKGEGITKLYCTDPVQSVRIGGWNKQGTGVIVKYDSCFGYSAKGPNTPEGDYCYFPIDAGDSGSAVLTMIGGEYVIVGLAFAGRHNGTSERLFEKAFACRIDNVAAALNIRAWDGSLNGINFSDTENVETYVVEGLSTEKAIIRNGKTYWQAGLTGDPATV